jgi:hypothetical protein
LSAWRTAELVFFFFFLLSVEEHTALLLHTIPHTTSPQ